MYGIDGRTDLPELELSHLEGYTGSSPVRVGNGAAGQLQLDIYGELLDAAWVMESSGRRLMHYRSGSVSATSSTGSARTGRHPTRASGRRAAARSASRTRG